jgi:hypothetical protein
MSRRDILFAGITAVTLLWGRALGAAAPELPLYDWDFTPAQVYVTGPQSIQAFVTVRNLPESPVNLRGARWAFLNIYPGAAAALGGPFTIRSLSSAGFESMNLAPGESARVYVATFHQVAPLPIGYSDLLIAGGHMRVLGPNDEFLDVGGLDRQLRVTVVPEPIAVELIAFGGLVIIFAKRSYLTNGWGLQRRGRIWPRRPAFNR